MQTPDVRTMGNPVHPLQWPWALESPPTASSDAGPWRGALLRCWGGTSPVMVQPPLNHHYVVMHLGGAKHVTRKRDGPAVSSVVEQHSLTLVPAGTAFVWNTEGPIEFAHLYLPPRQFESAIEREFDAEGQGVNLVDAVGCRDRFIEPVLTRMIQEVRRGPHANGLLLDSLLETTLCGLAHRHASRQPRRDVQPLALAPHRLRRVLDCIDARLGEDIGLSDLVAAAGSSQSHFSRAFRMATGHSPYRYLIRRRIDYAKVLLLSGDDALDAVSSRCGFNDKHQFALMFKRIMGVGPKRFRIERLRR